MVTLSCPQHPVKIKDKNPRNKPQGCKDLSDLTGHGFIMCVHQRRMFLFGVKCNITLMIGTQDQVELAIQLQKVQLFLHFIAL